MTSAIVRLRADWVGAPALEALEAGPREREAEQRDAHLGPQHSREPREAVGAALPLQPEPLEHLVPRGDESETTHARRLVGEGYG